MYILSFILYTWYIISTRLYQGLHLRLYLHLHL